MEAATEIVEGDTVLSVEFKFNFTPKYFYAEYFVVRLQQCS